MSTKKTPPPPMDDFTLEVFASQVKDGAEWGVFAAESLERATTFPRPPDAGDPGDPFFWLSALLVSSANVSKLFFGEEPDRTRLRDHFQVTDASPLRERTLRNHFEHFDERLAEWAEGDRRRNFIDGVITSGPGLGVVTNTPEDVFRHYDATARVATFRGERFELQPLVAELRRILSMPDYRMPRLPLPKPPAQP